MNQLPCALRVALAIVWLVMLARAVAQGGQPPPNESDGPEIGANDFRISDMGGTGDPTFGVYYPDVAYNSANHEYLVVWGGDDDESGLADDEYEIFGQRVDATTGAEVGENDFRISTMGGTGNPDFDAWNPAVAYNPANNEYLVAWSGNDDADGSEIFGQRIDAATGVEVGDDDFRISEMQGAGFSPAVAYNPNRHEYLVVWTGNDDHHFYEIFAQRLNADTGVELGHDDFRISETGPPGYTDFYATSPAIVHNSTNNQYLVAWRRIEDVGIHAGVLDTEIVGQRLNASGEQTGADDFAISSTGGELSSPAVAYSPADEEYLVVWERQISGHGIVGQRLDANTGGEVGENDFYISDAGELCPEEPSVTYNPTLNQYLVVWSGILEGNVACWTEHEVLGQGLDATTGTEVGPNDFRISDLGGTGNHDFHSESTAVARNSTAEEYLVVWYGDDNEGGMVDGENEVFGQRLQSDLDLLFADGFEGGDTSAWSATVR